MRRRPRKLTRSRLRNGALYHLERYGSSEAQLRRVLRRRVDRSLAAHAADEDDGGDERAVWIAYVDELLVELKGLGLIDDARLAAARARSLQQRGRSRAAIRANLRAKGLSSAVVDDALDALEGDGERHAAIRFAKRRRLGPFAPPEVRAERRRRHLAAMGRAGFDYGLARSIVEGDADELLEELPVRGW